MKSPLVKRLLCCAIFLVSLNATAQSILADSLNAAIKNTTTDPKEKSGLLIRLSEIYRLNKDDKMGIITGKESVAFALKNKNYTDAVKGYVILTNIYAVTQQFAAMKSASDSALFIAREHNQPGAMAYAWYGRVVLYKALSNADEVVKYSQMALKALEKMDDPYLMSKVYYQLYAVNSGWNNVAKVNLYARKVADNALKAKDYNALSNGYTALSVAYEYNYTASKNKAELDSVLFYLNKAEALYQQYPGKVADHTYAIGCINMANYYLRYFPENDQLARNNGILYANKARSVLKNSLRNQQIIASSLGILSEYARREGDLGLMETYLLQAHEVMKTEKDPSYYTLINVVQALADMYEKKGEYPKALSFQKLITEYNNKSFNKEQATNAQKLEIQYETEKKNNEMLVLRERESSRRLEAVLYGCIAVALLIGLIFLFRSYHFKLRYSIQLEKQLKLEKQESEMRVRLETEERARLKAEQRLMETEQEQLKKEVMANVLQIDHKNQMLHNIKAQLTDHDSINMQKILRSESMLDLNFEQAKLQIQQVHPGFFQLLTERAQQKLTPLDLKLCACLHLNMDTRQIAQLMHVEAKSVRMSRYRIKQKLGLSKEDDLNIFIQQLGKNLTSATLS
ncbi:helix-turn-helix transcriptional regulator [Pedobacter caeni]|uniref:Regulatory protein, luxR family n=1 Tax=Pedobacter caeni TaxID=288992 RepID=A0A1M4W2S2_9SPHI|nr:hypothetical protein [Pedobacter caeni]SHE75423.1 hypothetical protein SAMN04488522_1011108 [Pedobacter caeni]